VGYHWSIHQLTEYFEAVTSQDDECVAIRGAVERAIEALGAEVGAVVRDDEVVACVGLGRTTPPIDALNPAIHGASTIDLPPLGLLYAGAAGLDDESGEYLVVSRIDDEFSGEERQLLQGMARVLGLALRSLRTLQIERSLRTERELEATERLRLLDALGGRQRLLESMLMIQRAISHRAPPQTVLDTVTASASPLLGGAFIALVIASPIDGQHHVVSSSAAAPDDAGHTALVMATAAQAVLSDELVTRSVELGSAVRYTALAAPVHIEGQTAGSLVTVTMADDAAADVGDWRATLSAFAEQASVALTDARTVEAMRDAFQDPLTGLPNRALFMDRLNHSLQFSARHGTHVTVLFIDLDRFKDVNDSLGHAAGDELLAWFASRVRECVRSEDTAARIGGVEFAILLERTSRDSAGRALAKRLAHALRQPLCLAGREVFVSASVGIASSGHAETADDLLRNSDIAMYRAKRAGGGAALVYEPAMHTEAIDGLELGPDLHHAARRNQLRLEYQPIIDLRSGTAVAVEALVRWEHPTRGLVRPDVFIPLAERNGVIAEIGEWVLRHGCAAAAAWRTTSIPDLCISINVSARQLDDPTFADLVALVLRETGLPARALTLEITESAVMRDPERAIDLLRPLRALGVRLAIDDFGTGFSSLAYLQRLPADQLKIDKVFIDALGVSAEGSAIVKAVAELARTLNMETVAEGIETRQQHRILQSLSCNLGQGYHFARPLMAEAVCDFFGSSNSLAASDERAG
jgi:diguanylate cyclase (GGDEF)-like protein